MFLWQDSHSLTYSLTSCNSVGHQYDRPMSSFMRHWPGCSAMGESWWSQSRSSRSFGSFGTYILSPAWMILSSFLYQSELFFKPFDTNVSILVTSLSHSVHEDETATTIQARMGVDSSANSFPPSTNCLSSSSIISAPSQSHISTALRNTASRNTCSLGCSSSSS